MTQQPFRSIPVLDAIFERVANENYKDNFLDFLTKMNKQDDKYKKLVEVAKNGY